jgi:hypothetical protein
MHARACEPTTVPPEFELKVRPQQCEYQMRPERQFWCGKGYSSGDKRENLFILSWWLRRGGFSHDITIRQWHFRVSSIACSISCVPVTLIYCVYALITELTSSQDRQMYLGEMNWVATGLLLVRL